MSDPELRLACMTLAAQLLAAKGAADPLRDGCWPSAALLSLTVQIFAHITDDAILGKAGDDDDTT